MNIKSLTAPIALTIALGFGSTVSAQVMVAGQEVSDADLPAVQEHCRTLASGSNPGTTDPADGNPENESTTPPEPNSGTMDGAQPTTGNEGNQDNDAPDPAAAATAGTPVDNTQGISGNVDADQFSGKVNMEVITMSDCQAAGM